jgi:hypothetical protein
VCESGEEAIIAECLIMPWVSTFQVKMLVFPGRLESNAIVFPSGDQLLSSLISPMIFLASGSWVWPRDAGDESSNALSRQSLKTWR